MASTYRNCFKKADDDFFMKENFEPIPFCSSKFCSNNTNMLSHIQGTLVNAINVHIRLPEFIVFILDADLIDFLQFCKPGVSSMLGDWIDWLFDVVNKAINERLQQLPMKAQVKPQVYWVEPPIHRNWDSDEKDAREKFGFCLLSVAKLYDNFWVVKLRTGWDSRDDALVVNNCFTSSGHRAYWHAIDESLQFNIKKHEEFKVRENFRLLAKQKEERKSDTPSHGDTKMKNFLTGADVMIKCLKGPMTGTTGQQRRTITAKNCLNLKFYVIYLHISHCYLTATVNIYCRVPHIFTLCTGFFKKMYFYAY